LIDFFNILVDDESIFHASIVIDGE
jgi:hypothetical protein